MRAYIGGRVGAREGGWLCLLNVCQPCLLLLPPLWFFWFVCVSVHEEEEEEEEEAVS